MPHEEKRPLGSVALEASDDVEAILLQLEDFRSYAFSLEDLLEVLGSGTLVAGWIARVEPEHCLKVLQRLAFDGGPVDSVGPLRQSGGCNRRHKQHQQRKRAAMFGHHRRPSYHGPAVFSYLVRLKPDTTLGSS